MGMIKDTKANVLRNDAIKAQQEGRFVFTPMLNSPASKPAMSGGIDDWAVMIDAIESVGWVMVQWSVAADKQGRPQAYPVFRPRRH